jgi:hypothetical protein
MPFTGIWSARSGDAAKIPEIRSFLITNQSSRDKKAPVAGSLSSFADLIQMDVRSRRPIVERRVRSDRVGVLSPLLNDDMCLFHGVEDIAVEQLNAPGTDLSCAINTSIRRSSVTICSALNLFFRMTRDPFQAIFSQALDKKARSGQLLAYEIAK